MMEFDKDIFHNIETFHEAFVNGLHNILDQDSLGAFILCCANATNQQAISGNMMAALSQSFARLCESDTQSANAEDQQVFQKLREIGLQNLPSTVVRQENPWQLQFNAMRAFRPMRHAASIPDTLKVDFNAEGFHFNKPFMLKERFWEGRLDGRLLTAYYNKFPFADYHLLWLPDRDRQAPQYLTREYHEYAWRMCYELNTRLPGFAMAYNALGAYASVNHLHFQSYLGVALPITDARWQHNGGGEAYPVAVNRFTESDPAWEWISHLHQINQVYNLLYTAEAVYVIARQRQGRYHQPEWSPGFAWREVCGDIVTTTETDFQSLDSDRISSALKTLYVKL